MLRQELIEELMRIQHLCRQWGEKQDRKDLRRRKRTVIRALRPYTKHPHPDVRIWVEVIMFAIKDLYEVAEPHLLDDTTRKKPCSDPLYFFDGRMRNHADMVGCISGSQVLQMMKEAKLFPDTVWERISF